MGFLVQQTGFWLSHLTLQGYVDELADGDTFAISLLFVALFMPAIVMAPFAGVLADRRERRHVMMAAYAGMAVVATALAVVTLLLDEPSLLVIYGLALALGSTFSLIGPSTGELVANTVTQTDLASAISLQAAASNLTRVAGPIVAAPLIAAEIYGAAFGVFALTCLFAVAALTRVRVAPHTVEASDEGVLARIRSGLAHARERRPALLAVATVGVTSVFGVAHVSLIPSFARDVLDRDAGDFAWIVAGTGIGAIVGALTTGYSRATASLRRAAFMLVCYGVALAGFAVAETLAIAIAWQVAVGFFYFATMTTLQTLVQQVVHDTMRGRVMSLYGIAWGGIVWIGALLLGAMADDDALDFGVRTTLLVAAAVLVSWGLGVAATSGGAPTGDDYPD